MAVYLAKPSDGIAWITGASSGIGRQLALELAGDGYTVAATARSAEGLARLEAESASLAGRIVAYPCDVTDEVAMAAMVERIEREAGPIVLAVFNAGSYFPTKGERLDVVNFRKTYEVNVFGVLNGLVPLSHRMRARGHGQVTIVGSVSSYFGLPSAAAYGSTKAAINNLAEGLKFDFDKMNIRIQVINPGFVDTPLTEKNSFPMPALVPVAEAARRMNAAIRSGRFETTFPRRFTWLLKVLRLLPQPILFPILNRATGWKDRRLAPPLNGEAE